MLQNISIFEFIYNFVSVIAIIDFIYKTIFRLINKDVINLNTGMKIGNIIDIKINSESGKIESLILERKKFSSIFNSNDEIEIYWTQINKIGEDVILVESLKA